MIRSFLWPLDSLQSSAIDGLYFGFSGLNEKKYFFFIRANSTTTKKMGLNSLESRLNLSHFFFVVVVSVGCRISDKFEMWPNQLNLNDWHFLQFDRDDK